MHVNNFLRKISQKVEEREEESNRSILLTEKQNKYDKKQSLYTDPRLSMLFKEENTEKKKAKQEAPQKRL